MKTVSLILFGTAIAFASLRAEPKGRAAHPGPVPVPPAAPAPAVLEFQGDDLSLVLRTLARRANLNLIISDDVAGTVNMRLDNTTPREAINIIASAKELVLEDKQGVVYARPRNPPPPKDSSPTKSLDEDLATFFSPAVTKLYDSMLDYQARPETARKIARAKKALYDALLAEGFTKDEALRIILTNQELSLPNSGK